MKDDRRDRESSSKSGHPNVCGLCDDDLVEASKERKRSNRPRPVPLGGITGSTSDLADGRR